MAVKQYHFRLDDDEINAGVEHEIRKQGSKQSAVMADLLRRGLLALRAEREQTAWLHHQGEQVRLANPSRVNYGVQTEGEADVRENDHDEAPGCGSAPL